MKELKDIVICPHCNTPHVKKKLNNKEVAVCVKCGKILYKSERNFELKIFFLILSGIIFFLIAMFFPIVKINIIGYEDSLEIVNASLFLFHKGYIFISLFVFFTIFLFPFICAIAYFMSSVLLLFKFNKFLLKKILILITVFKDWCFLDIFFIAILVSLIKMFSYAEVMFNIGFVAFLIFLSIMFYIVKIIGVEILWDLYENI